MIDALESNNDSDCFSSLRLGFPRVLSISIYILYMYVLKHDVVIKNKVLSIV